MDLGEKPKHVRAGAHPLSSIGIIDANDKILFFHKPYDDAVQCGSMEKLGLQHKP